MSDKAEQKLRACPFCGKTETVHVARDDQIQECPGCCDGQYYAVNCRFRAGGCGATSGYYSAREKAIKSWNTRPTEDKLVEALEVLLPPEKVDGYWCPTCRSEVDATFYENCANCGTFVGDKPEESEAAKKARQALAEVKS